MKLEKYLLLFLIILISLFCIASVSAADDNAIRDSEENLVLDDIESVEAEDAIEMSDSNDNLDSILSDDSNLDLNDDLIVDSYDSNLKNTLLSKESEEVLSKSESVVSVKPSAETYKYGSNVKLTVGLNGTDGIALDGIVILTIDNRQYVANVTGGSTDVFISDLENNTYTVFAEFLGNDLYESSINNDATFTVNKSKLVTAEVSAEDIVYGESATISIANLSDVDGNLLSVFGGYQLVGPKTPYGSFNVRKGKGSFSVSDLPVGNYSAYIVFGNNVGGGYEFEYYIVNFTVSKATPTLNAIAKDIVFGENGTVNISVDGVKNEKLNETLLVTLNSKTYCVVDSVNGIVNLELPDLSVGNYTVGICFSGLNSTNYNWAESSCSFNVNKASSVISVSSNNYGDLPIVEIEVMDLDENPISRTVVVTVDNVDYAVDIVDGEGKLNIYGLIPNKYPIAAKFLGNENYTEATFDGEAFIDFSHYYANMDLVIADGIYGDALTVTVENVTDSQGNKLSGTVWINIYDDASSLVDIVFVKVEDGIGNNVTNVYPAGKFHARAFFYNEETDYQSEHKKVAFNVAKAESSIAIDYSDGKVTIALDGANGEKLNETICLSIDKIEEELSTDNGICQYDASALEGGNHAVYAVFMGNENYLTSSAYTSFIIPETPIISTDIVITVNDVNYGEKPVVNFTFADGEGNPLSGKLNVSVANLRYSVDTGEDGKGSLAIPYTLVADTYPIVASFSGNETHASSIGTNYFNVAKNATQIIFENMNTKAIAPGIDGNSGEFFYFTLKDANGLPIANTPMQIGFNGVVYTYEKDGICTDEIGTAKLQINLGYKGVYTFAICFLGDENYNASLAVSKITVACQTPQLDVPNKSYKASAKTKTLTASFKTEKGNPIANKTVKFTVNGKTYSAKTNDKGVASVNVSINAKGSYKFTAKYSGDSTFEAVSKTATLKIS